MKRLQNLLIYRFDFHHGNDQLLLCDPSQKIQGTFKFELQTSNLKHSLQKVTSYCQGFFFRDPLLFELGVLVLCHVDE